MRFPQDTHRHAIIGATGSGKTQAALWHLSHRNFHLMPWVIYNFKRDESIDEIPGAFDLDLDDIPSKPGIYIAHPLPDEDDKVERQMWALWERGNIGAYIDEGYMIGRNNRAFRALLTQGRAKRIPMIINSQRPVWMDRFVFSESEFFQVFRLQHRKDRRAMGEIVPADMERRIPEFHSWYYDVGTDSTHLLAPVPKIEVIHATFGRRLKGQKLVV